MQSLGLANSEIHKETAIFHKMWVPVIENRDIIAWTTMVVQIVWNSINTGLRPYRSLSCPQNVELIIIPKNTMVVTSACWYLLIPQSQCNAGPRTLNMVISMESAIQHKPTQSDNFTWNHPNPSAFTACVTVYVSEKVLLKIEKSYQTLHVWCILNSGITIRYNWYWWHFQVLAHG